MTEDERLNDLQAEHDVLITFLELHKSDPPPESEGMRITWQIYTGALTDAAKTLKAIIDFKKVTDV